MRRFNESGDFRMFMRFLGKFITRSKHAAAFPKSENRPSRDSREGRFSDSDRRLVADRRKPSLLHLRVERRQLTGDDPVQSVASFIDAFAEALEYLQRARRRRIV